MEDYIFSKRIAWHVYELNAHLGYYATAGSTREKTPFKKTKTNNKLSGCLQLTNLLSNDSGKINKNKKTN